MIKLDKELKALQLKDQNNTQDIVSEVKLIPAGDSAQDMHIMRNLAGNSMMVQKEEHLGKQIDLEKKNIAYNGDVFTIDQIKKLAIKYRLRFLNSTRFKGDIEFEAISKLKQFAKDTNTGVDEHSLKSKFFILAPAESFSLEVKNIKDIKLAEKIAKDPLLFYKIDDEHYRLIHKWGNDFSILRRLQAIYYKSQYNYSWINLIGITILSVLTFILANKFLMSCNIQWENNSKGYYPGRFFSYAGINVGCAILTIIAFFNRFARIPEDSWERTPMFSETNWNDKRIIKF